MDTEKSRSGVVPSVLAALFWLGGLGAWSTSTILDRTRAWEGAPRQVWIAGAISITLAGVLTLVTMLRVQERIRPHRERMATTGIVLVGVGVLVTLLIAWALPIWMLLEGTGMLLFVLAIKGEGTLGTVTRIVFGSAFLIAFATMISLTTLKVGTPDTYGDYPAAWTSSAVVGTVLAAAALVGIATWLRGDSSVSSSGSDGATI